MKFRLTTGLFRPGKKRLSFMTAMICIEASCNYMWQSSCVSNSCPKCGSKMAMPMAKWSPARNGMPKLDMGKVKVKNDQPG